MIEHTNDTLEQARNDVFILIGKCVLNLQLYERRLKSLLPHFEISSDGPTIEQQKDKISKMTLGGLIGQLVDKAYEHDAKPERRLPPATTIRLTTRFTVATEAAEVEQIKNDLADLVAKRNFLIHHFRDNYDLQSEENCLEAKIYLDSLNEQAKRSVLHIEGIAETMSTSRGLLVAFMASPEGQEFIDEILNSTET